jgi:hypothetical protein
MGVITAATSYSNGGVSNIATDSTAGVAKKAIVTGAVGGVAVAASGGSQADIEQTFLRSGGMVVVQSAQTYVTQKYVDPAVERADSYDFGA